MKFVHRVHKVKYMLVMGRYQLVYTRIYYKLYREMFANFDLLS